MEVVLYKPCNVWPSIVLKKGPSEKGRDTMKKNNVLDTAEIIDIPLPCTLCG